MQIGYYLTLGALLFGILWKGTGPMKRTILTILGVALFSLALAKFGLWPSAWYAVAMITADTLALWVITHHPSNKWQSVIGLTYVFQIITWIAYLVSVNFYGRADMYLVWWGLTIPALSQLILVGVWFIGGRAAHIWHRSRSGPADARSDSASVAK